MYAMNNETKNKLLAESFYVDLDWRNISQLKQLTKRSKLYEIYLDNNPLRFTLNKCSLCGDKNSYYGYLTETSTGNVYDMGIWNGKKSELMKLATSGDFISHIPTGSIKYLRWQFNRYIKHLKLTVEDEGSQEIKVLAYNCTNGDNLRLLNSFIAELLNRPSCCIVFPGSNNTFELKVALIDGRPGTIAHCDSECHLKSVLNKYSQIHDCKKVSIIVNSDTMLSVLPQLDNMGLLLDFILVDTAYIGTAELKTTLSKRKLHFWGIDGLQSLQIETNYEKSSIN